MTGCRPAPEVPRADTPTRARVLSQDSPRAPGPGWLTISPDSVPLEAAYALRTAAAEAVGNAWEKPDPDDRAAADTALTRTLLADRALAAATPVALHLLDVTGRPLPVRNLPRREAVRVMVTEHIPRSTSRLAALSGALRV